MRKIALDNTFISLLFFANAKAPSTVTHPYERLLSLIDECEKDGHVIYLPTPALAEVYSAMTNPESLEEKILATRMFRIAEFNFRAAVILGKAIREAKDRGDKKSGSSETWAKIKFDHQIVAIAKSNRVNIFYTEDRKQANYAREQGLVVKGLNDIEISPDRIQRPIDLKVVK